MISHIDNAFDVISINTIESFFVNFFMSHNQGSSLMISASQLHSTYKNEYLRAYTLISVL